MLKPLASERWHFPAAAHLLNRAGFGGPPADINRLLNLGPARAVSHLVDFESIAETTPAPSWAQPDPERAERYKAARQASPQERQRIQREQQQHERERMIELRGWWLQLMATGPRPLQEKMTLFWHGHFPRSMEKLGAPSLRGPKNPFFRSLPPAIGS